MTTLTRARLAADATAIAALGGPLLGNNLSITGMSFADTVMAGQLGARDLAGLAIGVAYYHLFLFIGFGLLMAVSPSVAHAYGADDARSVTRYARQSWWLVLALSAAAHDRPAQADWVLPAIGITPDILPIAIGYVHAIAWGMPGLLAFFSLRYTSEGLGRTKPIMYIGFLGLAAQRVRQLGVHVRQVRHAAARRGRLRRRDGDLHVGHVLRDAVPHAHASCVSAASTSSRGSIGPNWRVLRELTRIGAPIAGSILAEGGLFVAAALMMGAMGAIIAGGHQIALNYASFMFMVPLAISSATTIHVGHTLGRGELASARARRLAGHRACAPR